MAHYYARMLDATTGGEGEYKFDGPDGLFRETSDEIVRVFFAHIEDEILKTHADWELKAVSKNAERRVITAIGSLIPAKDEPELPFLLFISDRKP